MVARKGLLAVLACVMGVMAMTGATAEAAPTAPEVGLEGPSEVAIGEARLRAHVNPEGQPTTYRFEYGTTTSYGTSVPVPDGQLEAVETSVSVSQHVSGLAAGTSYHYRVVATNSSGTTFGEDATFTTYASPSPSSCSNEAIRAEQKATYLPDCRAYEMVSPLDKNGSNVDAAGDITFSSNDGNRVGYGALAGFSGTVGSGSLGFTQYVATREGTHWSSRGATPTPAQDAYQFSVGATTLVSFSEDLSDALVEGYDLPYASPGGISKGINYYDEALPEMSLTPITTPFTNASIGILEMWGSLRGFAPNLKTVTFEASANFLPEATGTEPKLYQWEEGKLSLAGILPDGTVPSGGSGGAIEQGLFAIEANLGTVTDVGGSRVAFVSPLSGSPQQLYLRRDGTSTAWVSEPETSSPAGEPQGVRFVAMTHDGHHVFFTSNSRLTDSASEGGGLYMYTDGPSPASEENLTFIGQYGFVGSSEDAKRIYLTGTPPGFTEAGIYLWDEGTWHFVSAETSFEEADVQVSRDGHQIAFLAKEGASVKSQMHFYDEGVGDTRCVSCLPTGASTAPSATVVPESSSQTFEFGLPNHPRFLSSDGRYVFFSTAAPLVSRDVNGLPDAYEYDSQTGTVSLLSAGTGGNEAWFAAASETGNDVFVITAEPLARGDTDTLMDVYDVRAGGGFREPAPATGPCVGDECQGTPSQAPSFDTASGFSGLGNTPPVVKASVKSKSKPLTRAQRLTRALQACKSKRGTTRKRCEAKARKKYGPQKTKKVKKAAKSRKSSSAARR